MSRRVNNDDWRVSVYGLDTPEELEVLKVRVPDDIYTLDYAEDIANTILDFVKCHREKIARLRGN